MREIWVPILILLSASVAHAKSGRSLPRGEEHPAVIEKVYRSPAGEVEFTVVRGNHSGFLRTGTGNLLNFGEVRGPKACLLWFDSFKTEELPAGCEFVFVDHYDGGRSQSVRSEEMAYVAL